MSTVVSRLTKFQVAAAALAVGAAAIAPIAANAAPAIQIPTAPIHTVIDNLAQAPGDFAYNVQVKSLQAYAKRVAFKSNALATRATRLDAYATAHPTTFFGMQAAATADRLRANRAALGDISISVCRDGSGYSVGPYGSLTSGSC